MEATIVLGLFWDNGKENETYDLGLVPGPRMEEDSTPSC